MRLFTHTSRRPLNAGMKEVIMIQRTFIHLAGVVAILAGAFLGLPGQAQAAPRNEPEAPQDIPDNIVGAGVSYYTIASPRVVWADLPEACPPGFAVASADGEVAPSVVPSGTFAEGVQKAPASATSVDGIYDESINRVSIFGSEPRTLMTRANQFCGQGTVQSNIVADDSFVYYTSNAGLVRLSVNANPGDQPELVTDVVKGYNTELAIDGTNVFIIKVTSYNAPVSSQIWKVNKATKAPTLLTTRSALPGNLQVSYANILFGSEMVGAVRGIDPTTGFYFDDTKRYVDALDISDAERHAIFEGNARRVFPRLDAQLKERGL